MRQIVTFIVLLVFVACNTLDIENPVENSVVSAYIGQDYWAADSLSEAYYFENTLFISAKAGNKNLVIKITNPVKGDNSNVEFLYGSSSAENMKSASLANVNVFLNVLDTINAQPSIVNGTFSGEIGLQDGETAQIREGKINNAVTNSLFCENIIRSYSSDNTDIGGKWELVRIVNRSNGEIQNPTCHSKVILSFYNENYKPEETEGSDYNFEISGPVNTMKGYFELPEENALSFYNLQQTSEESTIYNKYLENLVFSCVGNSTSYFINNTLMHMEAPGFICVFYRVG